MIGAIFLGVMTTLMVLFMDRALMGKEIFNNLSWLVKPLEGEDGDVALLEACGLGAGVFLARVATKFWGTFPALLALIVMMAAMLYIANWWAGFGKSWKAFFCFLVLEWILGFAANEAATVVMAACKSNFLKALVNALPSIAWILAVWSVIVGWLQRSEHERWASVVKVLAIILIICIILSCFSGVSLKNGAVIGGVAANSGEHSLGSRIKQFFSGGGTSNGAAVPANTPQPSATPAPSATPKPSTWYAFYNPSMLNDNDPSNDYNFGWNCYEEGKPASYYDQELRNRMKVDPALGAADMAWFDAILGSNYLGVFYSQCHEEWDAAINAARDTFIAEGEAKYLSRLDAFFRFLDHATKVEVLVAKSGIEDQMYMNPFTETGIPGIFVMKTEHEGHFLVYTFTIKGKEVQVPFRIECGFQPCNVERVMGIKPSTPAGGKGSENPPSPPTPPSPPPSYPPKDPTRGTPVGENTTSGPGPNTNNDKDPNTSTADQPTNSSSMTDEQYNDAMQDLADTNQNQAVGGDPSTPTVVTPPSTNVDSNADAGTGNGGVDTPTPVSAPVHVETPSGETPISGTPAGEWGGPPD